MCGERLEVSAVQERNGTLVIWLCLRTVGKNNGGGDMEQVLLWNERTEEVLAMG